MIDIYIAYKQCYFWFTILEMGIRDLNCQQRIVVISLPYIL